MLDLDNDFMDETDSVERGLSWIIPGAALGPWDEGLRSDGGRGSPGPTGSAGTERREAAQGGLSQTQADTGGARPGKGGQSESIEGCDTETSGRGTGMQ